MIPSGPQSRTIGTGDRSRNPVMLFRLCGQCSISPSVVDGQSNDRMIEAISPQLFKKLSEDDPKGRLSRNRSFPNGASDFNLLTPKFRKSWPYHKRGLERSFIRSRGTTPNG